MFLFIFTNSAILPLVTSTMAIGLYLYNFGSALIIGLLTSSFLPYLMPFVGFLYLKKTKKQPIKPCLVFSIEEKYALHLYLISICFAYGLMIPLLFVYVAISLSLQYILDRILITYWYKRENVRDDQLNNTFVIFLKYTVFTGEFVLMFYWVLQHTALHQSE